MTTLDTSENHLLPTALRYGLIGGLLAVVSLLIKSIAGMMTSPIAGILDLVIYGYVVYAAINALRALQGNQITFGRAIGVGVLSCVVMGLIASIFTYVYFNFIDPSLIDEVVQASLEAVAAFLPEEALEEAAESTRLGFTSLPRVLMNGIGGGAFMGLIASLIAGAIMKRDPEPVV